MGRCIVCSGISLLLLLIHPFMSSFFFLSNFHTLKLFVTLFSGTVRPRRLKLGTHVDSGWMYCVYRSQAAASYLSLISLSQMFKNLKFSSHFSQEQFLHFSFSSIIKHLQFLSHFSQELWGLESWNLVHMWTMDACIVYTGIRLLLLNCHFICPFFFFLQFSVTNLPFSSDSTIAGL